MAMYTTRVEILGAKEENIYTKIDVMMKAAGFYKIIQLTSRSPIHELPVGYYNWIGEVNPNMVLEAAINATMQLSKKVKIMVNRVDGIRGLA